MEPGAAIANVTAKAGSTSRQTFSQDGGSIGRERDNSWVLPHAKVSGHHALISYRDGGFYIEDIAAHEFGHALGLGHSTSPTATMYPSAFTCDSSIRSLDSDDISGVRALYPPELPPPPPTGFRIVR